MKKTNKESKGILQGIIYGLIPHTACIAFIIASIFSATALMQFFRPFLVNKLFFPALIIISLLFATVSSILYLRRNGLNLSQGIRRKWKYLSLMYGLTIGINLLFFIGIFPILVNASLSNTMNPTGAAVSSFNTFETLKLKVDIPCSGHAALITSEVKSLTGIANIKFKFPDVFEISYAPSQVTKEQILSLNIFKEYPATLVN